MMNGLDFLNVSLIHVHMPGADAVPLYCGKALSIIIHYLLV